MKNWLFLICVLAGATVLATDDPIPADEGAPAGAGAPVDPDKGAPVDEPAPVEEPAKPEEPEEPSPQYEADDLVIPAASADEPHAEFSAESAGRYLDDGATAWTRERQCISCHTNGTYLLIRPQLTKSFGPPTEEVRSFFVEQLAEMQEEDDETLRDGTNPAQLIYLAAGLAQWDTCVSHEASPETLAALKLMLQVQEDDGTWHSLDCWPPFESSVYQEATMAAMALSASSAGQQLLSDEEASVKIERLRTWLRETEPPHDYGRVLRLWTSTQFADILSDEGRQRILDMVREKQREDGGWSLRDFAEPEQWGGGNRAERLRAEVEEGTIASDGHMTGLALIVLQLADSSGSAEAVERGVRWLKENQRESGRWWTRSLNTDDWHFITFSGTAYPMLALQMFDE